MKKLYYLSSKNCPGCESLKEFYKEEIKEGTVEFIDIEDNPIAVKIMKKLGINVVPTPIAIEEDGNIVKVCELTDDFRPKKCLETKK